MKDIYLIISLVTAAIYTLVALRECTLLFQQNSYRPSRYFRYLSNYFPFYSTVLFGVVALALFYSSKIEFLSATGVLTASQAVYLLGVMVYARKKYKKPLVVTRRIRRLWATMLIIVAALGVFYPAGLWFAAAVPWVILVVANLVNTPMEKAITRWYINDARRIIRSMPNLKIIAITGSYGKSSTKEAMVRLLSMKYNTLTTPGNFNTTLGVVRTIRERLKPYHEVFVVEMGAKQRGDIKEICDIVRPSIGVITAVGEQHLETFGSIEEVQKTKFELIDALPPHGIAVLCGDYPYIASRAVNNVAKTIYYGLESSSSLDYTVENVEYHSLMTHFAVKEKGGASERFSTALLGEGNLLNIMASFIVAKELGVSPAQGAAAISQLPAVEHRLKARNLGNRVILDDAYNSNPVGARMALGVLRDFDVVSYLSLAPSTGCERIVITPGFVEMGSAQKAANRELGREIARSGAFAVVVSEVNREDILGGLKDENYSPERIKAVNTFDDAIAFTDSHFGAQGLTGSVMLLLNDLPDTYK